MRVLSSSYSLGFVSVQAIMQYENVVTEAVLSRPNKPVLPWRDSHSVFCFMQPPVLGDSHVFHVNPQNSGIPRHNRPSCSGHLVHLRFCFCF